MLAMIRLTGCNRPNKSARMSDKSTNDNAAGHPSSNIKMTKSTSTEAALQGRRWYVVDAADQVLGRLASQIAHVLRGKNKVSYTPHVDGGDFVVVINAEKIRVTGNKENDKIYHRHTGWMGGLRSITLAKQRIKDPTAIIQMAVAGMMPKNTLGRNMTKKLKVVAGSEHPYAAQCPERLSLSL